MKPCSECKKLLPLQAFSKKDVSPDGYCNKCKNCHNEYVRLIWYPKNRAKQVKASINYKKKNLLVLRAKQYGISIESLMLIISKQKGKCAICKEKKLLGVDHCHKRGNVRGLLCRKCNLALGLMQDDLKLLKSAIRYLKKNIADGGLVSSSSHKASQMSSILMAATTGV